MSKKRSSHKFELTPVDNHRLASLCGQLDEHLKHIEQSLGVEIQNRGHHFHIQGTPDAVETATKALNILYAETTQKNPLTSAQIHLFLQGMKTKKPDNITTTPSTIGILQTPRNTIKAHSSNQGLYLKNIAEHDINFGIGPAGTGKTYLAVACAVAALVKEQVSRILLVRPAVEAGERLGFLPGDLTQKVDPYFRPLYDALYDMLGFDQVMKLIQKQVIEIAPLAYMRGRTLSDSFIILDEGQNTTREQMKMFLTRIGFNSKVVITGDMTQTDLPKGSESGLRHCVAILKKVKGISITSFDAKDVVRHPLVQSILEAYEEHEVEKK